MWLLDYVWVTDCFVEFAVNWVCSIEFGYLREFSACLDLDFGGVSGSDGVWFWDFVLASLVLAGFGLR